MNLWNCNTPADFWLCQPAIPGEYWREAVKNAAPLLKLPVQTSSIEEVLAAVLGEGQFGPDHWYLGLTKRWYYRVKPLIPGFIRYRLRQLYSRGNNSACRLDWPIEARYVHFQWEVLRQVLHLSHEPAVWFTHLWPEGKRFALVLTHDVETADGQEFVKAVAELDARFGFRSSFNFVPERYPLNYALIEELKAGGFEIGIHGLKHDGREFASYARFRRRAERINAYLRTFEAVGFRAPLTLRHPEWMQELDIEYDGSFFDTDPFEPIPGGTMSIWPYFLGRFVELPSTLVQDSTLIKILGETTPRLWLDKIDFVQQYYGMALINTHPDYLRQNTDWNVYAEFLEVMSKRHDYWHALPSEVAHWWRVRAAQSSDSGSLCMGRASLNGDELVVL